jgi:MFS family permease
MSVDCETVTGVLRPYRQLAAVPHLPSLLTWSLVGRLHMSGTPLAVSFLVAGWTGSYAIAGLVGGALALGQGVAGPLRGRAVDRSSAPRLLVAAGLVYGVGLGVLGVLPASAWPVAPGVALLVGLAMPPANQVSQAIWPRLVHGSAREAVYAVEATLQELLWIAGPVLAAWAVAAVDARFAVALCAAFATLGALGFAAALRRADLATPAVRHPRKGARQRSVLAAPGIPRMIVLWMCLIGAVLSVDMVVVAWARNQGMPQLAGVLGAVWATGSAVGGLVAGGLAGAPKLALRTAGLAGGLALLVPVLPPVLDPSSPWLVGAVLMVGGAAIAPTLAACNSRLGVLAPEYRRAEVAGWVAAAATAGSSMALPAAGALLDQVGPAASAAGAALLAAIAALLALRVPAKMATGAEQADTRQGVGVTAEPATARPVPEERVRT